MKFNEKWKRFWTLQKHGDAGFTLVELIVVIAILAILGGVAVPAYSGYVEKANEAADQALLAEVNTAFAAACALNGEDHYNREGVTATINEDTGLVTVSTSVAAIDAAFGDFYEGGKFQNITALYYNGAQGMFEAGENVKYGNTTITVSKADVQKLKDSTWGTVESEELLNLVDGTLGYVEQYNKDYMTAITGSEDFKKLAAQALGVESYDDYLTSYVNDKAKAEYEAVNGEGSWDNLKLVQQTNYIKTNGLTEKYQGEANSNMAVVVGAQNVQAQKDAIVSILTTDPTKVEAQIKNNLTGENADPVAGLSQAAIAYGMYSSYMVSQGTDASTITPAQAWLAFEDDSFNAKFTEYMNGPQGQKDLDGFMASMNTIGKQDSTIVGNVVQNGVTNDDLQGALESILGQ